MSGLFKGKEQSVAKPRYEILDGLRGVAAVMVVWFHFFEAFATSAVDQRINHGYLAVDFFFVLSGFVLGYAYKDRWKRALQQDVSCCGASSGLSLWWYLAPCLALCRL